MMNENTGPNECVQNKSKLYEQSMKFCNLAKTFLLHFADLIEWNIVCGVRIKAMEKKEISNKQANKSLESLVWTIEMVSFVTNVPRIVSSIYVQF